LAGGGEALLVDQPDSLGIQEGLFARDLLFSFCLKKK
jgi:hypothetical protein